MNIWDPQFLISAGVTVATVVLALIILGITTRRVNYLLSELQAVRREMGLLDEAVQTVSDSLQARQRERTASQVGNEPGKP